MTCQVVDHAIKSRKVGDRPWSWKGTQWVGGQGTDQSDLEASKMQAWQTRAQNKGREQDRSRAGPGVNMADPSIWVRPFLCCSDTHAWGSRLMGPWISHRIQDLSELYFLPVLFFKWEAKSPLGLLFISEIPLHQYIRWTVKTKY